MTDNGPLSGFRIIDFSSVFSGPLATTLLADQGADVIKVEPPEGDIVRAMGGSKQGLGPGFLTANRGKRSIVVDLKNEAGTEVVKRLLRDADVLVQNFRPGAMERLGLGYDVVRQLNPELLYVSVSGFGEHGPYAHKRVYDPVIQALSGMADMQAADEHDRPRMVRTVIPDKTTGLTVAQAVTAGLLARTRTGEGQHIKVAMLDTMLSYLWPEALGGLTLVGNEANVKTGQRQRDLIYECSDGKYLTCGAISNKEWTGMCEALDRPEWLTDERFATPRARGANASERLELTAGVIATRPREEWLERLDRCSVPNAPVLTRPEIVEHEQVKVNDVLDTYEHPGIGMVRQPRAAAQFEKTPTQRRVFAPLLGEHSEQVLSESGYSDAEIDELFTAGVVRRPAAE